MCIQMTNKNHNDEQESNMNKGANKKFKLNSVESFSIDLIIFTSSEHFKNI